MRKFTLTETTREGKEDVYHYEAENGEKVAFHAHPTRAWHWVIVAGEKATADALILAACEAAFVPEKMAVLNIEGEDAPMSAEEREAGARALAAAYATDRFNQICDEREAMPVAGSMSAADVAAVAIEAKDEAEELSRIRIKATLDEDGNWHFA